MLLQFSVTNHRSIKETAIISMKAAADKTMKEILISPDGKRKLVVGSRINILYCLNRSQWARSVSFPELVFG